MTDRIVIVDDDVFVLETTEALLSDAGYEVHTTSNPFSLPSLLRTRQPDLVLIDVEMPQLAGGHLTRMFHGAYHDTVFLLYSGKSAAELRELSREYGAAGFVQKGGNPTALVRDIAQWLKSRTSRRG